MSTRAEGGQGDVLRVANVTVGLGGREILHDVSFEIRAGELTGLIGSNGAGKTTLLRAIAGLIAPVRGRISIDGAESRRGSRLVGYVPQKITLDPDMPLRARDLVSLGIDGHRLGLPLPSTHRRRRVEDLLAAVNASSFADTRVGNLSGGEQQRVLIAHALAGRPKLLLLDEPLANLDLRGEQEVVGVLGRIVHEEHVAVLISTHDMNPLLPLLDRIAYIARGRVASGTTADVVTTEALSRLYGHHVDVIRVHDRVLVVAGRDDRPATHADEHVGSKPVVWVV